MTDYFTPDMNNGHRIFVFGSNKAGRHGRGASVTARMDWGAERGVGVGRTGMAYAIPTKDERLRRMTLAEIKQHVTRFIRYAESHPELLFLVTRIGCGLSKYDEDEIRPMFHGAPGNCVLPQGWRDA